MARCSVAPLQVSQCTPHAPSCHALLLLHYSISPSHHHTLRWLSFQYLFLLPKPLLSFIYEPTDCSRRSFKLYSPGGPRQGIVLSFKQHTERTNWLAIIKKVRTHAPTDTEFTHTRQLLYSVGRKREPEQAKRLGWNTATYVRMCSCLYTYAHAVLRIFRICAVRVCELKP